MKISILLIEDDRDMRDLVARHLEHSGFNVQKAEILEFLSILFTFS